MGKLKNLTEIKKTVASLKRKKKKIVFTNGCFDMLHYGHLKYLEKCKRLGDILVIGLNSDVSIKKIKGKKRPINGQKERAAFLSSFEFVDYITTFDDATPAKLIKVLMPDVLAKGGDWKTKDIVGGKYVKNHAGRVVSIPFVKGYSTTKIIKRIKNTFS